MQNHLLLFFSIIVSLNCTAQIKHAEVKKYNTHITINGNKVVSNIEVEIKINTPKGTSYSEIDIYSIDKPQNLAASIYDSSGNEIKKLKKKDLKYSSAYSNSTFHTDGQYTSFTLLHNQYPYTIKYSYSIVYNNYIHLENWLPTRDFDCDIDEAVLSATLPNDYKFRTIENLIDTAYTIADEATLQTTYYWKLKNPQPQKSQHYSPPSYTFIPRVEIIPFDFHYGIDGSTESWETFGNWIFNLNQNKSDLTDDEKIMVHRLTDTIDDNSTKIKVLYHYQQDNTRYINVSLDLGGLQTYPAEYVCNNKYGDCKALSNYMQALLKEIGIKSHYTIVYAGINPVRIDEEYPSQQFSHVILCVPQPKDTIWLECTSSITPFNYLGSFTHNRKVLIIDEKESRLITTPALQNESNKNIFSTIVSINSDGLSTIQTKATLRGYDFEYFKSFGNNIPKSKQADLIDRINFMKGIDFVQIESTVPHRDSSYINLSFEATTSNLSEKMGTKILISPINHFSFKFEKPEKRNLPVVINLPIVQTDTILYKLSEPIKELKGIENTEFNSVYGSYSRKIVFSEHTIKLIRDIEINQGQYSIQEYEAFYNFIDKLNQQENRKILITQ
nr:DUF3857 domain-containing protein [uncultured Carboxylicivirga sp.]